MGPRTADYVYRRSGELLEAGAVRKIDISDLDLRVAEDGLQAIEAARKDFPGISLNYFGSIQNQVQGIYEKLSEYFTKEFMKANEGKVTKDQAEIIGSYNAKRYIRQYGLDETEGCFAWSLAMEKSSVGSEFSGVAVNSEFGESYDFFREQKEREVAVRHKPVGCDTPRATFDHEMGHEIDRMLRASEDKEIAGMYREMMERGNGEEALSGYAKTNIREFIAEAYSEYRNNPAPREYAKRVYQRLKMLAGKKEGEDK